MERRHDIKPSLVNSKATTDNDFDDEYNGMGNGNETEPKTSGWRKKRHWNFQIAEHGSVTHIHTLTLIHCTINMCRLFIFAVKIIFYQL